MSNPVRVDRLRTALVVNELDGIFISQPDNRSYLSGFNGSAGYLLITAKELRLATDFRYLEQVKLQAPDYSVVRIAGKLSEWFNELTDIPGLKKLGFESADVSHAMYRLLTESIAASGTGISLVPTEGIVETIRAVKEPEEIASIKEAVKITDDAFAFIEDTIRPGMTELEVAWALEKYQRDNGSGAMPFEIIVASGPFATLPHHQPNDREINEGDAVVIDMGARINGYCSDFTRTICIGEPDHTFKKVYDTVLGAQLTAISLIKSGISGKEADAFARTVIEEAGYGEMFGHSLGHGIGLVAHEQPRVGPNSDDILEDGMVFSVEPGIYVPGWGGVRIEDLAILENGAITILSKGKK